MSERSEVIEQLVEETRHLWLKSAHNCQEGPEAGQGRMIINYIDKCSKCLSEYLYYVANFLCKGADDGKVS